MPELAVLVNEVNPSKIGSVDVPADVRLIAMQLILAVSCRDADVCCFQCVGKQDPADAKKIRDMAPTTLYNGWKH